jgi:hypothetical protein
MDVVRSPGKMFASLKDVVEVRNGLPSRCFMGYFMFDFVLTQCPAGPPLRDRAFYCAACTCSTSASKNP